MRPCRALALLCALGLVAAAAGRAGPAATAASKRRCRAGDARASSRAACAKLCTKASPAAPPVFYVSRGAGCCACAAPPRRPAAPAAPPPPPAADYARLAELLREQSTLGSVLTLLAWDGPGEAEQLPDSAAAAAARTAQQEAVSARLRALQAAPELAAILARLQAPAALAALDSRARANVRLAARAAADAAALPAGYDARVLALVAAGEAALEAARAANDWALFAPALDAWVRFSREYAAARRPSLPAYDALLDAYTPGLTDARVAELLAPLKAGLPPLLAALRANGTAPDAAWLTAAEYNSTAQEALRARVVEALGFDFGRGRLDTAGSTSVYAVAPADVRVLAAIAPGDPLRTVLSGAWGAGFGAAQQGRRDDGLPASELDSVLERAGGLLFEDAVLSGAPGAAYLLPLLQAALPGFGAGKAPADLFAALNTVKEPPLSRLGADEVRARARRAAVSSSLLRCSFLPSFPFPPRRRPARLTRALLTRARRSRTRCTSSCAGRLSARWSTARSRRPTSPPPGRPGRSSTSAPRRPTTTRVRSRTSSGLRARSAPSPATRSARWRPRSSSTPRAPRCPASTRSSPPASSSRCATGWRPTSGRSGASRGPSTTSCARRRAARSTPRSICGTCRTSTLRCTSSRRLREESFLRGARPSRGAQMRRGRFPPFSLPLNSLLQPPLRAPFSPPRPLRERGGRAARAAPPRRRPAPLVALSSTLFDSL
jgi:carboxypeptidase Taq